MLSLHNALLTPFLQTPSVAYPSIQGSQRPLWPRILVVTVKAQHYSYQSCLLDTYLYGSYIPRIVNHFWIMPEYHPLVGELILQSSDHLPSRDHTSGMRGKLACQCSMLYSSWMAYTFFQYLRQNAMCSLFTSIFALKLKNISIMPAILPISDRLQCLYRRYSQLLQ